MIGNVIQIIQWLYNQDKEKLFDVKEYKEKRSLSQNAYMWALCNEIANVTRKEKDDVYFQMLKDYGQSEIMSMFSEIDPKGYLKYYEEIGTGIVNNKEFTHYKVYKGSSEYDTREMAILIDGVIEEAKQLGIQTLTPEQVAEMRLI